MASVASSEAWLHGCACGATQTVSQSLCSIIGSRLDYCNSLLAGIRDSSSTRIRHQQGVVSLVCHLILSRDMIPLFAWNGHCGACRRKWQLTDTVLCPCGVTRTVSHIVESCPLTKLNGGLSQLHPADEDAVSCLTSYGSWHAYEKKKKLESVNKIWIAFNVFSLKRLV